MPLIQLTAPAELPVTLAEAKAHLRVDGADDDTLIAGLLAAAVGHLDGAEGLLGRALVEQQWTLVLDAFPASAEKPVRIPLPPLVSVAAVRYVDAAGATQTWDAANWRIAPQGAMPGHLLPVHGESWPTTRTQAAAVEIDFTAGYGAAAGVPAPLKAAMLLLIGHWYANREAVNVGNIVNELPLAVQSLLAPYRILGFA
jgi:uncharacterized phiE125 gp8 family phage protein